MEKSKKRIIILFVIIALIFGIVLTVMLIKNNNKSYEEYYVYKINYFEDYIPGCNHDIYFLENNQIIVVSQSGNSTAEYLQGKKEMPKEEKNINFSEKNMQLLWSWANQILYDGKNTNVVVKEKILNPYNISDYNKKIINSLIHNDESYLEMNNDKYTINNIISNDGKIEKE